jgi:PAS domain S-box-containing protein
VLQQDDQRGETATSGELERELRETVARYHAILASTLDPVITIDANGVIEAASDSVERVLGWAPADLVGCNVTELMPEPHRPDHDGYLAEYRESGVTNIMGQTREFDALHRDGRTIPIEISVNRVDIPGSEQVLFTGIIRDLTARKAADAELHRYRDHLEELVAERTSELEASHEQLRLADRLASIGTLAAGLGHDMNNVLLPLRCRLDALDASDLPSKAGRHFDEVRKSVQYLQQLADGLHLLSLDPEDAEASLEGTDLPEWWDKVGPLLARGLPRDVRLATSWPSTLPAVAVPPHRLTQAILNLVVNAGEAVSDGGKVRIWAHTSDDHRYVRLGVTDDGVGMTPGVKRRALDPFFTTKKRGLGTGLGLSLVQGVVRNAGGALTIDSEPGEGTTIVLDLPVAGPAPAESPELRAAVSVTDTRLASFASTLLEAGGFTVSTRGERDPGDADVWVTDPEPDALEQARAFLAADDRRRVLALGRAEPEWTQLGAVIVEDPEDFEDLRERVLEAVSGLNGAMS